mmetsp:Transcript_11931/g.25744  ORF Transcript_11931/g.25744 Transcript_11931/m.25744 type:complete len:516 (-) Transcript_11931:98-1645(-)
MIRCRTCLLISAAVPSHQGFIGADLRAQLSGSVSLIEEGAFDAALTIVPAASLLEAEYTRQESARLWESTENWASVSSTVAPTTVKATTAKPANRSPEDAKDDVKDEEVKPKVEGKDGDGDEDDDNVPDKLERDYERARKNKSVVKEADHAALFDPRDQFGWIVFGVVCAFLLILDICCLNRGMTTMTFQRAAAMTVFWLCVGLAFNVFIFVQYGFTTALQWFNGYLLEYVLSIDNLFVFHIIFAVYKTPEEQKHKPLFWGIVGAIVFRLIFFLTVGFLLHTILFIHFVFGIFLIYTGIRTAMADDEDEDPSEHSFIKWCINKVPLVPRYDPGGAFFVTVPVDAEGREVLDYDPEKGREDVKVRTMATLLMVVVICLELSDILFAVDSVVAKLAEIPNLFIAFTSTVFAMFGLRAMFFVINELMRYCVFLQYALSLILILIGVKLMVSDWYHVPPLTTCIVLLSILTISVVASWIYAQIRGEEVVTLPEDVATAVSARKHPEDLSARSESSTGKS